MTKIRDRQPQNVSGGYERIFGLSELGLLISKVQSAVIGSGNELEEMIKSQIQTTGDLDAFLLNDVMPEGVYLATRKEIKACREFYINNQNPDFIVFRNRNGVQQCLIIELKDGHVLDTRKIFGEKETVDRFVEKNTEALKYDISTYFCAFNQEDKEVIWNGFKRHIPYEQLLTGRELCEILEVSYEGIVSARMLDAEDNLRYFAEELIKIPHLRDVLRDLLD